MKRTDNARAVHKRGELGCVGGKKGKALEFEGSNDYVNTGSNISWSSNQTKTASLWFKTLSNDQTLIDQDSTAGSADAIYLYIDPTNHLESWLNATGFDFGGSLNDGKWHNIVWTYNGSTETAYLDGSQLGSLNTEAAPASSGKTLFIGQNRANVERFNGLIDEVRIYNRALSADEVKKLYESGR